jgi:hypothetical protein
MAAVQAATFECGLSFAEAIKLPIQTLHLALWLGRHHANARAALENKRTPDPLEVPVWLQKN